MIDDQEAVLANLTRELVQRFAPERIVLFGSRARGDHHPESDYDVIMVLGDVQYPEMDVRRIVQQRFSNIEIFVGSRERFERRRTDVGTLEYAAEQEGRILYARAGMPDARRVRETAGVSAESVSEWTRRAQHDFTAMDVLSTAIDVRDTTVFHAHQAVEKTLKALLVANQVRPPRTHDLEQLLTFLPGAMGDDPRLVEACAGLQTLWPSSRYPHEPIPTSEQVDRAVGWARRVREIVNLTTPRSS